jgi:3-methyladenine DNA glycosylase AlkD
MDLAEIKVILESMKNPKAVKGMGRFGITTQNNLGISIYRLRDLAKQIGTDHNLALEL